MDKHQKDYLRPPVVTIMGHVDHGKTTLLDTIRKSNVVAREHGGITQHIGAYQINHNSKLITFIDTPGHAAFEKMRSRGAEVADIVVLVVAANDGVKPQTVEAIKHIRIANKPIIVAITKVDLPNINIEKVKKELQSQEVVVESYGGDVPVVEVSATKNQGINELLDLINLVWQMSPQESHIDAPLEAVVVESYMDKFRGAIVDAVIKKGILRTGQKIQVDSDIISVRALRNDIGQNIKEAQPAKPVEILGFKKTLDVGSIITELTKTKQLESLGQASFEEIIAKSQAAKDKFKIIIKADVSGSLEAITSNLPGKIFVVSAGVGEVQPTDINLAKVVNAPILAFNVKISTSVRSQADREKVLIREYKVIYQLIEDMDDIAESFEAAKHELKIKGIAKIVAIFDIEGKKIAGSQVTKGKIKVGDQAIIKSQNREGKETKIASLKKFRKEVESASSGQECGIAFAENIDFNIGDIIESLG
ncbi:MAG: Translation initiation factor IF-2 [Candidatus Curtissbacteria bacterium GW2011_GWA1_40_9]|uniref:Translation initiation factor IF-2 n=1 Tax=Candidatus Curtissbacteria bacterium GW2011_GWA1_40_9 TaxID=1618408 RepID=A0A0G0TLT3_9BACT|nr:MAG: Translation initiation factor IF-2 [Candidatus Curtissbacteria bacterium GW2011_GWA1_40_9]